MAPAFLMFAGAILLRLVLIAYGAWQDANFKLKYTDIDYVVFTDAAQFMAQGQSPYMRATYRYTPLLALLLQVNIWHVVAGKVVFALMDLCVGYCIYSLLHKMHACRPIFYTSLFLFNPVIVNVSTRGNADCLVVFLVVATLYFVMQRQYIVAAVIYGLAVHTKIYPIVFALALVLHIWRCTTRPAQGKTLWHAIQGVLVNWSCLMFAAVSGFTFLIVTGLCYWFYGWQFLFETYLYHFGRTDNRHNLSPYFYDIYLSLAAADKPSMVLKVLAFIPQFFVLLCTSVVTYTDLPLCLYLLTHIFVIFNKVCTVQYFVWYLALLPLVLPNCHLSLFKTAQAVLAWVVPLLTWFWFAYRLEFLGHNTFLEVWLAGLGFFAGNVYALVVLVRSYQMSEKCD